MQHFNISAKISPSSLKPNFEFKKIKKHKPQTIVQGGSP
jgi:hypothetical protein